jgi:hypothetical protein
MVYRNGFDTFFGAAKTKMKVRDHRHVGYTQPAIIIPAGRLNDEQVD